MYKEHFEFSESVRIFLEINENYDFKRCPYCGKFLEYVFIYLFNLCENFYMKIYRLNFNNENIFEFIEDTIINKIINNGIMYKQKFISNKYLIKEYINKNFKRNKFFKINEDREKLKNIFDLFISFKDLNNKSKKLFKEILDEIIYEIKIEDNLEKKSQTNEQI